MKRQEGASRKPEEDPPPGAPKNRPSEERRCEHHECDKGHERNNVAERDPLLISDADSLLKCPVHLHLQELRCRIGMEFMVSNDAEVVGKKLAANATPCFVSGVVLVLLASFSGQHGLKEAVADLYKHAIYIHPFLICSVAVIVCVSLCTQGADANDDWDKWFWLPTLKFFSHLFSVGLGACLPLAFVAPKYFFGSTCHTATAMLASWVVLLTFAALSTAGSVAIERRQKDKSDPRNRAGRKQIQIFGFLALVSIYLCFQTASWTGSTSEIIHSTQVAVGNLVCPERL
jgi:hypothetical protein